MIPLLLIDTKIFIGILFFYLRGRGRQTEQNQKYYVLSDVFCLTYAYTVTWMRRESSCWRKERVSGNLRVISHSTHHQHEVSISAVLAEEGRAITGYQVHSTTTTYQKFMTFCLHSICHQQYFHSNHLSNSNINMNFCLRVKWAALTAGGHSWQRPSKLLSNCQPRASSCCPGHELSELQTILPTKLKPSNPTKSCYQLKRNPEDIQNSATNYKHITPNSITNHTSNPRRRKCL